MAEEGLSREEVQRYSRQLLLPEIGVEGQKALKSSRVLIVGAGGLGCPAGIYLAASGVGKIGIVDHDVVELNNLHRQILHKEKTIQTHKTESFSSAIKELNSSICCVCYPVLLDSENIKDIIIDYDIVIDATDNVATRYLLNDACVIYGKPLVSGSALRLEGQLTVYNYDGGPCYRCLFPVPPPPETVTNCSDGGVLGVVPGVIGSLQALETIKLILGLETYSRKLLLFDALSGFKTVRLRPRNPHCGVCGECPSVSELIDYHQFCNSGPCDKVQKINVLNAEERVSCDDYKNLLDRGVRHVLVDVRSPRELDICRLPNCTNIPFSKIKTKEELDKLSRRIQEIKGETSDPLLGFVVCRRGNDSQRAVKILKENLKDVIWRDIEGGLTAWANEIDPSFPIY
ncbi:adenylyltransferase and sulfurtransferase MOCS3 [Centruroides vittatus]|uniref:adenylyltransferase and sulfurtransferase MOCS3 n=1 Tax=Centruroides vittatus TaxID=120091 RepID=UPI00350F39D2